MKTYTCTCDPGLASAERQEARYSNMTLLPLQPGKQLTKRLAEGAGNMVAVDACVKEVIEWLWSLGIETSGCCCGHNGENVGWFGFVNVEPEYCEKMVELGFEPYPGHDYTFLIKKTS